MIGIVFSKHKLKIKICNEEVLGMSVDISEATRKAKELYETIHDVKQSMITGNVVTDLNRVIKELKIKVIGIDIEILRKKAKDTGTNLDEDISGFLLRANGRHTIFLNKNDPVNRKRFTIAHEIGHLQLNHLESGEKASTIFRNSATSQGIDEKEIAANAFAAELLMPEDLVRYTYNFVKSVGGVARAFRVSESASRNRLKNLGVIDSGW